MKTREELFSIMLSPKQYSKTFVKSLTNEEKELLRKEAAKIIEEAEKDKEDKAEIAQAFAEVLKQTRDYADLRSLEYIKEANGEETVVATFDNGKTKTANVSYDSGIAMISDIMRQIVEI